MQLYYSSGQELDSLGFYNGTNTIYVDGTPSAQWDGDGVRVNLGGITCHSPHYGDGAPDAYMLQIQVTGPRGVDPTQQ